MGSDDPRVLGPMLFLLLVTRPPVLIAGSFWPTVLGWGDFNGDLDQERGGFDQRAGHRRSQTDKLNRTCDGAFDLYFLVDASDSVKNRWKDTYRYVEELVKKYTNPKLRMSFITYSTQGQTIMKLTSDRNKIQEGLTKLRNVVPSGASFMQEGFKMANQQIEPVYSRNHRAASLIINLIASPQWHDTVFASRNEAYKARSMRAKVYSVGLKGYDRSQLRIIAGSNKEVYGREDYSSLDDLVVSLLENSCLDVMGKDTFFACVGENYQLGFYNRLLHRDRMDDYVCRYNLDNITVYTLKAINMTKEKLICPGHVFEEAGQVVIVDYSLDNGVKYESSALKTSSRNCGKKSNVTRPTTRPTRPTPRTSPPPPAPMPLTPPPTKTPVPPLRPPHPPQLTATPSLRNSLVLVPALLVIPLLFCCVWCRQRTVKEPPPARKPEKEPEICPIVIVPCCVCQEDRIRRMDEKLDILCDFVQNCKQVSRMGCQPRDKVKCPNITLMNPPCVQMPDGQKICLGPRQKCFPLNSCHPWCQHDQHMLPTTFQNAAADPYPHLALCRSPLSLPPP